MIIGRSIIAMIVAGSVAACDTTDPRMGIATTQNIAAHQAAARAPSSPLEGGSAVHGAKATQRYLNGTVHQPELGAADPASVSDGPPPAPPK